MMLDRLKAILGLSPKDEPEVPGANRVLWSYLIVQVGMLAGLAWKWEFFTLCDESYHRIQIVDSFFPEPLRSPDVIRWAYCAAVGGIVVGIFGMWIWIRRVSALVSIAGLMILCIHQGAYNDATFTTSFWVGIWVFWFTMRMERESPRTLLRKAAFLSRAMGSMILLGGAVGKWTPEYWSGQVLYDIYFIDRDYWTFNWLKENYDTETLKTIAIWYSRKVTVVETLAGLTLWRLPPRIAGAAGATIFFSIAALSNFWLFSVLWCLIGLSLVGLLVMKEPASPNVSAE